MLRSVRRGQRHPDGRRLAAAGGLTLGATLAAGGVAHAATFTVNSLADPVDPGHTTLHDALVQANAAPNPSNAITFASGLSGSIGLTTNLPSINYALDIIGPGAGQLTVSGNHARGIFHAVGLANPGLQISGLTLSNGNNVADGAGGAIFLAGGSPARVSDTVLGGNTAAKGGAVYALNGSLGVQRSTFTGNTSTGLNNGGAIQSYGTAVTVSNSLVSGNSGDQGGGIKSTQGSGANGSLVVQGSTVSGNHASTCCGGIVTSTTQPTLVLDSTISGNTSSGPSGGMYTYGPLTVIGSTIAGNSAASLGGGLYATPSPKPNLRNTIVAGNSAPFGPDVRGGVAAAFSLIGNPAGATIQDATPGSNLVSVDPQLLPLAGNGGPTPTMALSATSPAIDKGSAFGLSTDQRGSVRAFDFPPIPNSTAAGADGSDIGAFELQPSSAFSIGNLSRNKRKGTALLELVNPGPDSGTFTVSGTGLKTRTVQSGGAGPVQAVIAAKGKAKRKLLRRHRRSFSLDVIFTASGAQPSGQTYPVKLIKKRVKKH
jgi:predicted outer membrane repeat protein